MSNFDGPLDPPEDDLQECPVCDGCGCTCGATDCKRHCCEECHPTFGECLVDGECGWIPTARYMQIQADKRENRLLSYGDALRKEAKGE